MSSRGGFDAGGGAWPGKHRLKAPRKNVQSRLTCPSGSQFFYGLPAARYLYVMLLPFLLRPAGSVVIFVRKLAFCVPLRLVNTAASLMPILKVFLHGDIDGLDGSLLLSFYVVQRSNDTCLGFVGLVVPTCGNEVGLVYKRYEPLFVEAHGRPRTGQRTTVNTIISGTELPRDGKMDTRKWGLRLANLPRKRFRPDKTAVDRLGQSPNILPFVSCHPPFALNGGTA